MHDPEQVFSGLNFIFIARVSSNLMHYFSLKSSWLLNLACYRTVIFSSTSLNLPVDNKSLPKSCSYHENVSSVAAPRIKSVENNTLRKITGN